MDENQRQRDDAVSTIYLAARFERQAELRAYRERPQHTEGAR
jgi:hypothetical protein